METRSEDWDPTPLLREAGWMRALALRLVQDVARADDLVQDTLVAALQRRPGGEGSLRPWLARVLRNRWAGDRRSEARALAREEDRARPEALPSSVELLERAEVHRRLVEALTRLREPYRSVLLLRFHEGLEPTQIARREGLPPATVRSQLKRGLAQLREALDRGHADRRSWSLALIPFAVRGPGAPSAPPPFVHLSSGGLPVMILASTALLSAIVVWSSLRPEPAGSSPGVSAAPQSHEALAVAHPSSRELDEAAGAGHAVRDARATRSDALPAAAEEAFFEGTLRHARSGEPLPYYALNIYAEGAISETLWTDAQGLFRSARPWPPMPLQLSYLDHPELDGAARSGAAEISVGMSATMFSWDPERGPLELEAVSGARYDLELSGRDPVVAQALAEGSLELAGSLCAAQEPPSPFAEAWRFDAPLRSEGGAWLRFSPTYGILPSGGAWRVGVISADGLLGAEAEVPAGDWLPSMAAGANPIALELEARARLDVTLVSPAGSAPPAVALRAADPSGDGAWRPQLDAVERNELPDGRREWLFQGSALPGGAYSLLVRCDGFEPVELGAQLVAGEVLALEIPLEPAASISHVAGELCSDSGTFQERMFVRLRDGQERPITVEQPTWREVDGRWVAPFRFENLDPGEYRLDLRSSLSNLRWSPVSLTVRPPADDVVLLCHDEASARMLTFRVSDATSAEAVEGFAVSVELPGCARSMTRVRTEFTQVLTKVADDAPVDWFVHAPGYAPQHGDRSALAPEGLYLLADIRLERGWGARILARVQGQGGSEALAGVEVLLDGVVAGVTDAQGRLDLVREEQPGAVQLRHPEAEFVGGDHDPDSGALTGAGGIHSVRFEL